MSNINEVARRAGVSPVTVSRVLNDTSYVSQRTREKVEKVIRELRYVPNQAARSLRSRRSHVIALIVPDITNPFWTTVTRGVEDVAQVNGYAVMVGNMDEKPEKQAQYLETLHRQRVDGVLLAPAAGDASHVSPLLLNNMPFVLLDRSIEGVQAVLFSGDSIGGAYALTKTLLDRGMREIILINGPKEASTARERAIGFCVAMAEAGLHVDKNKILWGEFKSSSGYQRAEAYLDAHPAPEAFFSANNAIALGLLRSLKERSIQPGFDCQVVSFDDLGEFGSLAGLSSLAVQPAYEMGQHAARTLLDKITKEGVQTGKKFPCKIIHYASESVNNAGDMGTARTQQEAAVMTYADIPALTRETLVQALGFTIPR